MHGWRCCLSGYGGISRLSGRIIQPSARMQCTLSGMAKRKRGQNANVCYAASEIMTFTSKHDEQIPAIPTQLSRHTR
jgi:hypothetical protein